MSAIGDYVHLTAAGYNTYGIYRKTKSNKVFDFQEAKNKEIEKIKSKLSKDLEVTNLETILNSFFQNVKTGNISPDIQLIIDAVREQMDKEFNKLGDIDFSTGDVTLTEELKQRSVGQIRELSKNDKKGTNQKKIESKINRLKEILEILKQESHTNAKKLEKGLKEVDSLAKEIYGDLTDDSVMPKKVKNKLDKEKNIVNKINQLIVDYATLPPVYLQKGEVFEFLIPYIQGVSNGIAIEKITEQMNSLKLGGKREDVKINPDFFIKEITENGEIEEIKIDDLTIKQSQGKVDVIVDINGQSVGASVKNVNLSKDNSWIHTVSGSNLLFFLQDIAPDFVNHYLNLNATHSKSVKNEKISTKDKEKSRLTMGIVLAAKSLTGAAYERTSADIFIVNDNKTGKVRIVTMRKLVDMIKNISDFSEVSVKLGGGGIMGSRLFKNKFDEKDRTGASRIAGLLNDLHSIQINSSIKGSFFINAHGLE